MFHLSQSILDHRLFGAAALVRAVRIESEMGPKEQRGGCRNLKRPKQKRMRIMSDVSDRQGTA